MRARLRGPPDLAPIIKELQAAGKTSLRAIAEGLNAQNIPTSRGDGEWTATQVMRILERLDPFVTEVGGSDSLAAWTRAVVLGRRRCRAKPRRRFGPVG